jgi:hypothetical protein
MITQTIVEKFFIPIAVAAVTYWLFKKNDEYIKRRQYSTLGVAIMESFLEEVNNGIEIMRDQQAIPLPVKSWDGLKTISDDVLLRIIAVSKDIRPISFPPREIRIHCKNYFEHMSGNWANAVLSLLQNDQSQLTALVGNGNYVQAAENVKAMLIQCKELLEKNEKRLFSK